MFRALYTAASGMSAQQMNLDNIANNLANSSTTGFRGRRLQFQDLVYQNIIAPGSAATAQTTVPDGLQIGLGTRVASTEILQTQGDMVNTGNPLDVVIQGQGFFQVQLPSGEIAYTRDGSFHLDQNRTLVTADGNQLQPTITIGAHTPVPNLTPLLEALERAGRSLQKAPPGPKLDTSSKAEVTEYADKLRRLKSTLEQLQPQLEERRDAIRSRLGRIRAALD